MFKNLFIKRSISFLLVLTFLFTALSTSVLAAENTLGSQGSQNSVGKISLNKEKIVVEKNGSKTVYSEKGNSILVETFNKAGKKVSSETIASDLKPTQGGAGVITPKALPIIGPAAVAALSALLARFSIYFQPSLHFVQRMAERGISSLGVARIILFGQRYYDKVEKSIVYWYNGTAVFVKDGVLTTCYETAVKTWRWIKY